MVVDNDDSDTGGSGELGEESQETIDDDMVEMDMEGNRKRQSVDMEGNRKRKSETESVGTGGGIGPSQPKLWKYPVNKDIKGRKTRTFVKIWYNKFPWLEYNVKEDAAFCFCCRQFPTPPGDQSGSEMTQQTFTEKGFRNWAKAIDPKKGFAKHEHSAQHKTSYEKWINFQKISQGKNVTIESRMCPGREQVIADNREYFRLLFKYVIWFSISELPTRGHDEAEDSSNPGNWLTFISLQLETNPRFRELNEKLKDNSKHSVNYYSKTSYNGFIEVIASETRLSICEEISHSKLFSVLIDESKDVGKREELALVARYFFKEKVRERCFNVQVLTEFDAPAIKTATQKVIDEIIQLSDGSQIASLGADGASVMSGQFGGVAELLRSESFPWLIYIHCTAHRLNLMVNDLIRESSLSSDVIQTVNSLNTFLNIPKVREVYKQEHTEMFPRKEVKYLTQQIEIRWGCKFEAISLLAERLPLFLTTMVNVSNNETRQHDPKHVEQACGFYHKLVSGKFIVCLAVLKLYLAEMYYLSKELQHEDINWTDVSFEIGRTKRSIEEISPEKVLLEANDLCSKINVPLTLSIPTHNTRSRTGDTEEAENIHEIITNLSEYMQEKVKEEFGVRFDSKNIEILKSFGALDPGNENYLNYSSLEFLLDHFHFLDIDRSLLKMELDRAKTDLRLGLPISMKRCENLLKLIFLKNTVATSTASVERVFSGMSRTCTKLRSKLTPERLGDYLTISMNRELVQNLDIDKMITNWSKLVARKVIV